jgi:hypothetical protein
MKKSERIAELERKVAQLESQVSILLARPAIQWSPTVQPAYKPPPLDSTAAAPLCPTPYVTSYVN